MVLCFIEPNIFFSSKKLSDPSLKPFILLAFVTPYDNEFHCYIVCHLKGNC